MRIIVTGGAGYIGSHTVVQLLEAGHDVHVVDNLSNSSPEALRRVAKITGKDAQLHQIDIRDLPGLHQVFGDVRPDAVIHFAGLKAVGESVEQPGRYYDNNVHGTLQLLQAMAAVECFSLVFSSSATVYGATEKVPMVETDPLSATNPYGWSKLMIEQILQDHAVSDDRWHIALLRYFNPVGAHESGLIGEDPQGIPNNLVPFIAQVAVGRREKLSVFGSDYPTPDGTGVRDYIHVDDLAAGHLAALTALADRNGCHAWNLGSGQGNSVLEMVKAFEAASGQQVPYQLVDRRPGDIASSFADAAKARQELNWQTTHGIDRMCADVWRWQSGNPNGYAG